MLSVRVYSDSYCIIFSTNWKMHSISEAKSENLSKVYEIYEKNASKYFILMCWNALIVNEYKQC